EACILASHQSCSKTTPPRRGLRAPHRPHRHEPRRRKPLQLIRPLPPLTHLHIKHHRLIKRHRQPPPRPHLPLHLPGPPPTIPHSAPPSPGPPPSSLPTTSNPRFERVMRTRSVKWLSSAPSGPSSSRPSTQPELGCTGPPSTTGHASHSASASMPASPST